MPASTVALALQMKFVWGTSSDEDPHYGVCYDGYRIASGVWGWAGINHRSGLVSPQDPKPERQEHRRPVSSPSQRWGERPAHARPAPSH